MSINHVIDNNESDQLKINIECKSLTTRDDLNVICVNDDEVNLKMPNKGVNGNVLNSDGVGGVYWGSASGSSGVDYQGINPVTIGTHYKISNTTGSEVINSQLVETSGEINFNLMDITNARYYNNTVISSGDIESVGTDDLNLFSANGTIRLNSETSAEDNKIINCLDPTLPTDVATKNYVDTQTGAHINYNGGQPTVLGEMLKFSSTDGTTVDKSVMVESVSDFNLGSLAITNVGDVDGVDISTFKTDYDSKVNQDVKNTASPTFVNISASGISNGATTLNVNGMLIDAAIIYGSETSGTNLNLFSTTNATKGNIILHDQPNVAGNRISGCADPVNTTDVATKNYVDTLITAIPEQAYDIIVPLTSESGTVSSTGIKYTFCVPRTFTLTTVKACLTTAQASGNAITISIQRQGTEVLSPTSGLTFVNGQTLSNQPSFVSTPTIFSSNDVITCNVTQFGDGTGVGLKVTLLGNV